MYINRDSEIYIYTRLNHHFDDISFVRVYNGRAPSILFTTMTLSVPEKNAVLHHFSENHGSRRTADGQGALDAAYAKLSSVKCDTIVRSMNSHVSGMEECANAASNLMSRPSSKQNTEDLCSCAIVTIGDNLNMNKKELQGVKVKLKMAIPTTVCEGPHLFAEVLRTVVSRENLWQNASTLRAKLFEIVYEGGSSRFQSDWITSADSLSVSKHTKCGTIMQCSTNPHLDANQVKNTGDSDHRFAQRLVSEGVTRSYSQQPMMFTALLEDKSQIFRACIYPCSVTETGLFVGTLHASGFERPFKACSVIANNTMMVHPQWGVHEADATHLMTPYARSHVSAIASMYVKTAIMKAVLGNLHTSDVEALGDMDEPHLTSRYNELREMLSLPQITLSANIWGQMHQSGACDTSTAGTMYGVTCVAGTVDSFKNDISHTRLALHTKNVVDACFEHNNVQFNVHTPLIVSMYGTYYHPW